MCFQGTSKIRAKIQTQQQPIGDPMQFSVEWRHQKGLILGLDSETCFKQAMNRAREASLIFLLLLLFFFYW